MRSHKVIIFLKKLIQKDLRFIFRNAAKFKSVPSDSEDSIIVIFLCKSLYKSIP